MQAGRQGRTGQDELVRPVDDEFRERGSWNDGGGLAMMHMHCRPWVLTMWSIIYDQHHRRVIAAARPDHVGRVMAAIHYNLVSIYIARAAVHFNQPRRKSWERRTFLAYLSFHLAIATESRRRSTFASLARHDLLQRHLLLLAQLLAHEPADATAVPLVGLA